MTAARHKRIKAIFLEACDLPPAQRGAFLDDACGSDAQLRASVEEMLAGDSDPGGFERGVAIRTHIERLLEEDSADRAAHTGPRTSPPPTIRGYKIVDLLGEGGFGTVYRAEQESPVRRTVALKVLKAGMDTAQVIARFDVERQALAAMDHPSFARVYDAGQTDAGRPYFAMELVAGVPLTKYCESGSMSLRDRLSLFVRVCNAVQHAHQKGLIHRDLKPSNVLVVEHDAEPLPKLIDFGIARAIDGALGDRTQITEAGQFIGTPEYMSPEQAAGSADIDTRADIFSLGVLLYELLTGTTPLEHTEPLRGARMQQWQKLIAEFEPPSPSTRLRTLAERLAATGQARSAETRSTVRMVRGDLDWITMRALDPDRERRYASAAALAEDITRFLRDEPVTARPPTAAYRVAKFTRKHRAALIVATGMIVLLCAGVVGTSIGLVQALAARDAEAAQRTRANAEAQIAREITKFLTDDLLGSATPYEKGKDVTVREMVDAAAARLEGRFANQPLVEAGIRVSIGATYLALGRLAEAEPQLTRGLELRTAHLPPTDDELISAVRAVAQLRLQQGRRSEAEALLSGPIARLRDRLTRNDSQLATLLFELAAVRKQDGDLATAEQLLGEVLTIREAALPADAPDTLSTRGNLIGVLQAQSKLAEATPLIEKTLEVQHRLLGADNPHTLYTRSNLALNLQMTGRLEESDAQYTRVLEGMARTYGPDHYYIQFVRGDLALLREKQDRSDDASSLRTQVIAGLTKALGAEHPETLIAIERLGDLLYRRARHAEAEPHYQTALDGNRRQFGYNHAYTRASQLRLARTCLAMGRLEECAWRLESLLQFARDTCDAKLPEYTVARAELLFAQGDFAQAEALLLDMLNDQPLAPPIPASARADALRVLARWCDESGQPDDAAAWRAAAESPARPPR